MIEPTADQRRLLNVIWQAFRREGNWPSYLGVDQVLDREGLQLRPLVESMPPGLMLPDIQAMSHQWFPRTNDELRVQIAGLVYCDETEADLGLITRAVRYLADRERAYVLPSLSNPQPLLVSSDELRTDLGLTDGEAERVYALLTTFEWRVLDGGGGNPQQWSYRIDVEEVRRYRDVRRPSEYLAARREADRPRLAELPPLPSFKLSSVVEHEPQTAPPLKALSPWRSKALARPLRHPVIATVVGGLALAAILWIIHLL